MDLYTIISIAGVIVALVMLTGFKTVREGQRGIVEKTGRFESVRTPGIVYVPVFKKLRIVNMGEKVAKIQSCPVITKDNVTLVINANVYYQMSDIEESIKIWFYQDNEKTIKDKVGADLLEIFANYSLKQVPSNLKRINAEVRNESIQLSRHFAITKIDIENIKYPEEIQTSINKVAAKYNDREANRMKIQNEKELAEELEKIEDEKSENESAQRPR